MRLDKLLNQMRINRNKSPNIPPTFWLKPVKVQREELKEIGLSDVMAIEWVETNEADHATG
ncbi:hypothetical protein [Fodinibius sp. Rm-B-1B1-1]|uniref:hypothetical protein n=1 Tax=Fodinibius alkaliphilus TaxID=3140241 RepID=UPI00315A8F1E